MQAVDRIIAQRLASGVPLVGQISQYIIAAGGKRLRPAMLLMVCGALGYREDKRFTLAAVVEFIHTATLLHDDVVDESTLRRGRATANENFGNPASVLVGDFLYSRAFQMMVETGEMRIMEILADATNVIAEGRIGGFTAAPQVGFVDHIVVQQGGGVDEFDDRCQLVFFLAVEAYCPSRQQEQGRTHAFAATQDDVFGDLTNQDDIGMELPADDGIDCGHVRFDQGIQCF